MYNFFFVLAQLFEILLGCSPILSYTNIYMHLYFVKHDLNCLCWMSKTVPLWSSPLVPGLWGGQPMIHAPWRILADSARKLPASPRNNPYCHKSFWPFSATFCEQLDLLCWMSTVLLLPRGNGRWQEAVALLTSYITPALCWLQGSTGWMGATGQDRLVELPVTMLEVWDGLGASNQLCPKALCCTAFRMEIAYH